MTRRGTAADLLHTCADRIFLLHEQRILQVKHLPQTLAPQIVEMVLDLILGLIDRYIEADGATFCKFKFTHLMALAGILYSTYMPETFQFPYNWLFGSHNSLTLTWSSQGEEFSGSEPLCKLQDILAGL